MANKLLNAFNTIFQHDQIIIKSPWNQPTISTLNCVGTLQYSTLSTITHWQPSCTLKTLKKNTWAVRSYSFLEMTKSFDEEFLEILEMIQRQERSKNNQPNMEKIPTDWEELMKNHLRKKKLNAIKHLNVSFSGTKDETLQLAMNNRQTITNFRNECLSINELTENTFTHTIKAFNSLKEKFKFLEKDSNSFSVLFSHFVTPNIYPTGEVSEFHLSQIRLSKLLLLPTLFKFKKNA